MPDNPYTTHDAQARAAATEAAVDSRVASAELRARIGKIEALLSLITARVMAGQPIQPTDTAVLDFFGISNKNPNPGKAIQERVAFRAGLKRGVVECPSCGSNVVDLEGILDETCTFCGGKVKTDG